MTMTTHSNETVIAEELWLKFNINFHMERMTTRRYMLDSARRFARRFSGGTPAEGSTRSVFWALRGISFTIKGGEVVGIIGRNGAGKSTLLKVLAGIYSADRGQVITQGRVGTLLSLGAGFNNELTGRENIILSGICMGLPKKEIQEREPEISEFSGLGDFVDAPIKTYSNGMRARLGFAIAINIDPDILLIDEVLQAGDAAFRRKSGNILQSFHDQNKTIIVVTHSMGLVTDSCNRAILLDQGKVIASGDPREVVEKYKEIDADSSLTTGEPGGILARG